MKPKVYYKVVRKESGVGMSIKGWALPDGYNLTYTPGEETKKVVGSIGIFAFSKKKDAEVYRRDQWSSNAHIIRGTGVVSEVQAEFVTTRLAYVLQYYENYNSMLENRLLDPIQREYPGTIFLDSFTPDK
jgi:hypothetical protein